MRASAKPETIEGWFPAFLQFLGSLAVPEEGILFAIVCIVGSACYIVNLSKADEFIFLDRLYLLFLAAIEHSPIENIRTI
jgi:hypothetical protein